MIAVPALLQNVSRYLTDYDANDVAYQYVEWSRADLMSYMRRALGQLALSKPEAFRRRVDIPVPADGFIELPETCQGVLNVVGYVDKFGVLRTQVRQRPVNPARFEANRPLCAASSGSAPSVGVDNAARNLYIDGGVEVKSIAVNCCAPPTEISETSDINIESKYSTVLEWWMVAMAFGADIESVPMRERSDACWKRGYDALGMTPQRPRGDT